MARQRPESPEARALRLVRERHGIDDPLVVERAQDVRRATGEPIYRFRVASLSDANRAQHEIVLDRAGAELNLDEIRERDSVEYFRQTVGPAPFPVPVALAAITVNPVENHLVLNPGDTHDEVITVTIPPNASVPKADVYFLADTTGSMGEILAAVQAGANNILTALNGTGLDLAYGVGNYRDFPFDPFAFQHQLDPTNVAASVTGAINAWLASGGGDTPEGQLFALDRLAVPSGPPIGWRSGAKRIVVWFGDAPGHDPVCAAISGQPADITQATVTAKLVAEQITVLAISVSNPGLDADPVPLSNDYLAACGAPGGAAGQGTAIATATGGQFVGGIDPGSIVTTIINLVTAAVSTINNVNLIPAGATTPFVTSITPAGGYGPLVTDREHKLVFNVRFTGVVPCKETEQVFTGTLDVVVDSAVVAQKRVEIKVPACVPKFVYSVKFVCGTQPECPCDCVSVRPGIYATEINIYNFHRTEVEVEKRVVPVVFAGAPSGRQPRVAGPRAGDRITLPGFSATMDDCCRIAELLLGAPAPSPLSLTIGFLEITSDQELSVTAVYTASNLKAGSISIDVEQIQAKRVVRE
jgi:hypothetical protein